MNLFLLGLPRLLAADGRAHPLQEKDAALLALIALDGPVARARVAAMLWPGADAPKAANNLRQRLFRLRRLTGVELVLRGRMLSLAASVTHDMPDADRLDAALRRDPLALSGDVLGSHHHADAGELAAWVRTARACWRTRRDEAIERLSRSGHPIRDWMNAPDARGDANAATVDRRLATASAPARQLAVMAAVCGDAFTPQRVAAALGCTPVQLVMPWQELVDLSIFHGHGFVELAMRAAILARVPAGLLPLLHADAGAHGAEAAQVGGPTDAFRVDWRAAHRAVVGATLHRAVEMADGLSVHASTTAECAMALELRARIFVEHGDAAAVDAAGDAVGLALEAGDRAVAASARHQLGCALWIAGRPTEALDALSLAEAAADALDAVCRHAVAADREWVMARVSPSRAESVPA